MTVYNVPMRQMSKLMFQLEASFPSVTRKKGLGSSFDSESDSDSDSSDSSDSEDNDSDRNQPSNAKKQKNTAAPHRDVHDADGFHERSLATKAAAQQCRVHSFTSLESLRASYVLDPMLVTSLTTSMQQQETVHRGFVLATIVVPVDKLRTETPVSVAFVYSVELTAAGVSHLVVPTRTLRVRQSSADSVSSHSSSLSHGRANLPVPFNVRAKERAKMDQSSIYSIGLPRDHRSTKKPNAGALCFVDWNSGRILRCSFKWRDRNSIFFDGILYKMKAKHQQRLWTTCGGGMPVGHLWYDCCGTIVLIVFLHSFALALNQLSCTFWLGHRAAPH